jgi:hypothetical protein
VPSKACRLASNSGMRSWTQPNTGQPRLTGAVWPLQRRAGQQALYCWRQRGVLLAPAVLHGVVQLQLSGDAIMRLAGRRSTLWSHAPCRRVLAAAPRWHTGRRAGGAACQAASWSRWHAAAPAR